MTSLLFVAFIFLIPVSRAEQSQEPEVSFLKQLVSQSSGTSELDGVKQVQQEIATELNKIGFVVEEFSADDPVVQSKQFVATRKGTENKFITFVTKTALISYSFSSASISRNDLSYSSNRTHHESNEPCMARTYRVYGGQVSHDYKFKMSVSAEMSL